MISLRRRLLIALLVLPPLCAAPGAYWVYLNTMRVISQSFDYELIAVTRALNGLPIAQIDRHKPVDNGQDDDVCIQVWDPQQHLLYHSDEEIAPFPGVEPDPGLQMLDSPTGPWRSYTLTSPGVILQVAQPMEARQEIAFNSAMRILLPLLLALPLWAFVAWFAITRGLKPLRDITAWLNRREAHAITPLPAQDVPTEVAPMVRALNELLLRLTEALSTQRTFIADAAHSLRTPLAALRIQLESVRKAGDDQERQAGLESLSLGIDRASRMVQQLLTLAHQEPGARPVEVARPAALDAILREVVAAAIPLAKARGIDLGVTEAEPVSLRVDISAIRALLDNLIDNAVRYSAPGGRVDTAITAGPAGARIEIIDDGPGIPQAERRRVFDRFYRGEGASGTGSGLGLAIAAEIAQRHNGRITLEDGFPSASHQDSRPGLRVIVDLGELTA